MSGSRLLTRGSAASIRGIRIPWFFFSLLRLWSVLIIWQPCICRFILRYEFSSILCEAENVRNTLQSIERPVFYLAAAIIRAPTHCEIVFIRVSAGCIGPPLCCRAYYDCRISINLVIEKNGSYNFRGTKFKSNQIILFGFITKRSVEDFRII